MVLTEHRLNARSTDDQTISVRYWPANGRHRGTVQILHGLAEHCARYERVAGTLNAAGLAVAAHDHRGHGERIAAGSQGVFAPADGWQRVLDDVFAVQVAAAAEAAGPVVLLGHSMGSYIAQAAMLRDATPWSALALSGSNFAPRLLLTVARWIGQVERWRIGADTPSKLMNQLSFGNYNKPFSPPRTEFDWLSRDPDEVDRYVADPWCGFTASAGLWVDLLGGLISISSIKALAALPPTLPVYVFGGADDPISAGGKLETLAQSLDAAGVGDVTLKLYPGARHEVFNETNRVEVEEDLIAWLNDRQVFADK